jgi:hypothetical protein
MSLRTADGTSIQESAGTINAVRKQPGSDDGVAFITKKKKKKRGHRSMLARMHNKQKREYGNMGGTIFFKIRE